MPNAIRAGSRRTEPGSHAQPSTPRAALQGFNDNRDAQEAAAELKADQQRKAAELAAIGRGMHAHYRTELANLGADYQRDKARLNGAHKAERDALHAEVRQFTEKAIQGLTEEQRREQRTIAWRERSLLGRMWNAYDAGRPSGGTSGRVGQTLWATFSRSARLSGLRQSRAEQRNAVYNDLKAWTRDRMAEVRARHGQEFNATYQRFQAARSSTLGQYEVEQKEYRRLWVERNQANREAWQTLRAKCLPLARERQRHMRQKENIRRIEEEWTQDRDQRGKTRGPRVRDQGRDR